MRELVRKCGISNVPLGGPFWSSMHSQFFRAAAFALLSFAVILPASASPWAEVGDNQLRSDIGLLQAGGVSGIYGPGTAIPVCAADVLAKIRARTTAKT